MTYVALARIPRFEFDESRKCLKHNDLAKPKIRVKRCFVYRKLLRSIDLCRGVSRRFWVIYIYIYILGGGFLESLPPLYIYI